MYSSSSSRRRLKSSSFLIYSRAENVQKQERLGAGGEKLLEGAVHEDDARVFNPAPHLGVSHILVEHDTVENTRILNLTSGQLK